MSRYDDEEREAFRSTRHGRREDTGGNMLAAGGRSLWNIVKPIIADSGADFIGKFTRVGAAKFKFNPDTAEKIVKKTVQEGVYFAANLKDLGQGVIESNRAKNKLLDEVGTLLHAEFDGKLSNANPALALMRSKNEVIQVAAGNVLGLAKAHAVNVGAGLIEIAPHVMADRGVTDKIAQRIQEKATIQAGSEAVELSAHQAHQMLDKTVGAVSPWIQKNLSKLAGERYKEDTALNLITGLAKQMKENAGSDYFTTPAGKEYTLGDYVFEVFKRHQDNMAAKGAPKLTERSKGYEELKVVSKKIAEAMQDTTNPLDPMALVLLVGERKVFTTGLKVASEDRVAEAINHARDVFDKYQKVDVKDFMANTAYTLKELKTTLDEMPAENKAFFAQMFPRKVLKAAGVPDEQIVSLRKQARQEFEGQLVETVTTLAATDEKELHSMGFGATDIKRLREVAAGLGEGGGRSEGLTRDKVETAEGILIGVKGWQEKIRAGRKSGAELTPEGESVEGESAAVNRIDRQAAEKQRLSHAAKITKRRDDSDEVALSV